MKIAILANSDIGLYKFRKELIQELINQGNEVYISLPNGVFIQPLTDLGCIFIETDVDRRGVNPFTDFKLIIRYLRLIAKLKPDLVITYTIKPNIYGGIVCRFLNLPYTINITGLGTSFQRDGFLKKLIVFSYRIACRKAHVIFFENEENQRSFVDNRIVKKENTYKLNGAGVNLEEYMFSEYPKNDSVIRFLFIGRVMKEKGVDELFDVAKRIKDKFDNVEFDIVGQFEDDYEEIINDLDKKNVINYYGFQMDVKPFIRKAHCFVLPSYHEGMANTLLEAGAMGRPLITSNIYGCKDAVLDGETGYLVNSQDCQDLYAKISDFILLPFEQKRMMGYKSCEYVRSKFDKRTVVTKTINRLKRE